MLYDNNGDQIDPSIDMITMTRTRTLDGGVWSDDLEGDIRGCAPKGYYLLAETPDGWMEWRVTAPDDLREDGMPEGNIQAVASVRELDVTRIFDADGFHETGIGARRAAAVCVSGTRWRIGQVDGDTTADIDIDPGTGGWTALQAVAETYGLELSTEIGMASTMDRVESRVINLTTRVGSATPTARFEYGADLTRVRRTYSDADVITRLYAFGKTGDDGKPVTIEPITGLPYMDSDDDTISRWSVDGTPAQGSVTYSDVEDPSELFALARADLARLSTPEVSYEGDVVDLDIGYRTHPGDTVQVTDTTWDPPLRLEARIIGITDDLITNTRRVTLGSIVNTVASRQTAYETTARTVTEGKPIWDAGAANASNAIIGTDSAIQAAAQAVSTALDAHDAATGLETRVASMESSMLRPSDIRAGENVSVSLDGNVVTVSADTGEAIEPITDDEIRLLVWGVPGQPVELVNAGFETGDFTGWTVSGNAKVRTDDTPPEGEYAAYLDSSGTLRQTVAITGGALYVVSCWLMNGATDRTMGFRLSFDKGDPVETIIPCRTARVWEHPSLRFTAPDGATTVTFEIIGSEHIRVDEPTFTALNPVQEAQS